MKFKPVEESKAAVNSIANDPEKENGKEKGKPTCILPVIFPVRTSCA